MKRLTSTLVFAISSFTAAIALAQQPMGMKDMKDMPMGKSAAAGEQRHKATATVKKLDPKKGVVTLAHGPVESLNWPAMTMSFKVKDKSLLKKLGEGKKVDVEFTKQGDDYVVLSAK